jgi:hypothetical protein
MPAGDRTGPTGMGPMSGRGAGYCGGLAGPGAGRGRGRGAGGRSFGGRGWRHWFHATGLPGWMRPRAQPPLEAGGSDATTEKQALQNRVEALQAEMDAIKQRLGDVDKHDRGE